jgi:hypothetical protein
MRTSARVVAALIAAVALIVAPAAAQAPAKAVAAAKPATKPAAFDASPCLGCHEPIKTLYGSGKHKSVGCNSCHDGTAEHLGRTLRKRPTTKTDLASCGNCHKNQYATYAQMNWHRTARFEKEAIHGPRSGPCLRPPDDAARLHQGAQPATRPHVRAPRPFVVDRAFGGRFAPKEARGATSTGAVTSTCGHRRRPVPDNTDQKAFKPGTAAAANPVCLSCKTQDHILDWAFMGDPAPTAKWSRTSKVVEIAKASMHLALNCIFCHDPHAAKPRIVRDALIEAWSRDRLPTPLFAGSAQDEGRGEELGVSRAYAQDRSPASATTASCSAPSATSSTTAIPVSTRNTGEAIPMSDRRTNYFPFVDVNNVLKAYDHIRFRDFRNQFTGAAAVEGAALRCRDLLQLDAREARHRLRVLPHARAQGREDGQVVHVALADQSEQLPEGNLPAVPQPVEREAGAYVIESLYAHYQGKVRNAEFWLSSWSAASSRRSSSPCRRRRSSRRVRSMATPMRTGSGGRPPMEPSFHNRSFGRPRLRIRSRPRRRDSRSWTTRSKPSSLRRQPRARRAPPK